MPGISVRFWYQRLEPAATATHAQLIHERLWQGVLLRYRSIDTCNAIACPDDIDCPLFLSSAFVPHTTKYGPRLTLSMYISL